MLHLIGGGRVLWPWQTDCCCRRATVQNVTQRAVGPPSILTLPISLLVPRRYYNCYTLSVDLTSVCDATRQAFFTASPNDPNFVDCSCPGDPFCPTYNLVKMPQLYLTVNVWLTAFTNQGSQCAQGQVGWEQEWGRVRHTGGGPAAAAAAAGGGTQ
jgi:hypothetical protein